jgi:hypothetical protein
MAYATSADIADYSRPFEVPDEWTDDKLDDAILDAGAFIDAVTREHFEPKAKQLILNGKGGRVLRTVQRTHMPIVAITQVQSRNTYDKTDNFDEVGAVVPDDQYRISESRRALIKVKALTLRSGLMLQQPIWLHGEHNYKVTGTFGRANTPKLIKLATVWLVREQIVPGYVSELEQPIQEMFPDGYMYILFRERSISETSLIPLTGYRMVDTILRPYVNKTPLMVAITNRDDIEVRRSRWSGE